MIGYGVALLPLADQLKEEEKKVLAPFFADDLSLDGPAQCNACQLRFMMDKGPDRGYFPEPDKSIHICNSPADLEASEAAFKAEGLKLNYHDGH
eukprot:1420548-Ditylum_brightwellii.AAC.1